MASWAVDRLYTSPGEQEEGLALSPNPGALLGARAGLTGAHSSSCPTSCGLCPQDSPGDNECVMELEGREVAVEARVECEPPPDARCHVTCRRHQVRVTRARVGEGALATGRPPTSAGCTMFILGVRVPRLWPLTLYALGSLHPNSDL